MVAVDTRDRAILDLLQVDAGLSIDAIASRVALSSSQTWRRIRRLEEAGVIARRVALLDRRAAGLPTTVFVTIRAPRHSLAWDDAFRSAVEAMPEIVEVYRLTGEADYLLRLVVPSVASYDAIYKQLIAQFEFADVNAAVAMEEMKFTTAVPTAYL